MYSATPQVSSGLKTETFREDLKFEKWGSNVATEGSIRDESNLSRVSSTSNYNVQDPSNPSQRNAPERGPLASNLMGTGLPGNLITIFYLIYS